MMVMLMGKQHCTKRVYAKAVLIDMQSTLLQHRNTRGWHLPSCQSRRETLHTFFRCAELARNRAFADALPTSAQVRADCRTRRTATKPAIQAQSPVFTTARESV